MATVVQSKQNNDWLDALFQMKQLEQQRRYQAIAEQQQARDWGNVDQAVEAMNRQRGVGFLDRMIGDKVADTGFGKLFGFKKPTTAEDFGVRAPGSGLFEPKTAELREVPAMAGSARERVEMAKADAYMKKIGGYSTKDVKEAKDAQQPDYEGTFAPTEGRQLATKADYAAANQEDANRAYNETAQSRADAYNAKIAPFQGNLEGETYQEQMGNLMRRWNSAPANQREAMRSEFQRAEYELNDRWGRSGKYKSMFGASGTGTGKMKSYTVKDAEGKPLAPIDASSAEQAVKAYKQRNKITDDRVLVADEVGKSEAGSEIDFKREKERNDENAAALKILSSTKSSQIDRDNAATILAKNGYVLDRESHWYKPDEFRITSIPEIGPGRATAKTANPVTDKSKKKPWE
jgi:hypothetical protein